MAVVGGWVTRLAALAIALALAWLAISETVSHQLATRSPDLALRLRPGQAEALAKAADRTDDEAVLAGRLKASLAKAPLNSAVVRGLAVSADEAGQTDQADRLLALATRRTRRDTLVQQSLYYRGLVRSDYPAALGALDPLLRRGAVSMRLVTPDLAPVLSQRAAVDALASQLAASPPWRSEMIAELSRSVSAPEQLSAVFDRMAARGSPATRDEKRQLIGMWVAAGDYAKAAQAAGAKPGELTDGDFDGADPSIPFNWRLQSSGQATAELALGSNGQKSLRVGWPASRSVSLTQQIVILPAAEYRFSGTVRVETMPSNGWIVWKLACANTPQDSLVEIRQTEAGGWISFGKEFTVPAACPALWLTLTTLGGEGSGYGAAWYDHLAFTRVGG